MCIIAFMSRNILWNRGHHQPHRSRRRQFPSSSSPCIEPVIIYLRSFYSRQDSRTNHPTEGYYNQPSVETSNKKKLKSPNKLNTHQPVMAGKKNIAHARINPTMYRTACTLSFSPNASPSASSSPWSPRRAHGKPSWNLKIEGSTTSTTTSDFSFSGFYVHGPHARLPVRNKHKN